MAQIKTEYYTGSDCTKNSGDKNRVLTLSNKGTTSSNGFLVYVSGLALSLSSDYTVVHKSESSEITFLNPLWDDMTIVVQYYENYLGISGDFIDGPLNDFGVDVIRTPVTVTTDFNGNKTYSDGTNETIKVVFENPETGYLLEKPGLTKVFDAKMYTRSDQTINKYDKITYDSRIYRVSTVSTRNFNGTALFKSVILFFIDE